MKFSDRKLKVIINTEEVQNIYYEGLDDLMSQIGAP